MVSSERRDWIQRVILGAATLLAADACLLMANFLGQTPQGDPSPFAIIGFPACGVLLMLGGVVATSREPGRPLSRGERIVRRYALAACPMAVGAASLISMTLSGFPHAAGPRAALVATGGVCLSASLSAIAGFMATSLGHLRGGTTWPLVIALATAILVTGIAVTGTGIWLGFYLSPGDIADGRVPAAIHAIIICDTATIICGVWLAVTLVRLIREGCRQLRAAPATRQEER